MAHRLIQVGTGGMGAYWCTKFLPPFVESGRIEVVAAVDINAEALQHARAGLGLEPDRCYTDLGTALDAHQADLLTVVVPPAFHEEVVDAALDHDLDILSEKPIADTLAASVRIVRKVEAASRKMAVTMSHRFDQDKTTLREEVRAPRNGTLDYLVCRFTSPNRVRNSWGAFRHHMADPLMVEGAIHHLDLLVDLAGAPCSAVSAMTWNPQWGEYAGDSEAIVLMEFENGVHAVYEGATSTAVGLNAWGQEYIRAECEWATIVLDRKRVVRFELTPNASTIQPAPQGTEVPLLERQRWTHAVLIEDFLDWLDGGAPSPTAVAANLHATAVMFAAIESSRQRRFVDVAEHVASVAATAHECE